MSTDETLLISQKAQLCRDRLRFHMDFISRNMALSGDSQSPIPSQSWEYLVQKGSFTVRWCLWKGVTYWLWGFIRKMGTVFDALYFLDWFQSQWISFAGSVNIHSCRDLWSFGSGLTDPAIADVTRCSIKCHCQTYSDTVEVLLLISNIAIEHRVVDPAPFLLSRLTYQTNKVILSTSSVLKKLQFLRSVDNCQCGSFCCTIVPAVFPRWLRGREEKTSSLVKIPVVGTGCSRAPCGN